MQQTKLKLLEEYHDESNICSNNKKINNLSQKRSSTKPPYSTKFFKEDPVDNEEISHKMIETRRV